MTLAQERLFSIVQEVYEEFGGAAIFDDGREIAALLRIEKAGLIEAKKTTDGLRCWPKGTSPDKSFDSLACFSVAKGAERRILKEVAEAPQGKTFVYDGRSRLPIEQLYNWGFVERKESVSAEGKVQISVWAKP